MVAQRWFTGRGDTSLERRAVYSEPRFANRFVVLCADQKEAERVVRMHNLEIEKKGPAEVAASPSHGSTNPTKDQDMNEAHDSASVAQTATVTNWQAVAYEYESTIDHIRHLVGAAERIHESDMGGPRAPGFIPMRAEAFYQVSALLDAIVTTAKHALEPAR